MKINKYLYEIVILYVILFLLNYLFYPTDIGYLDSSIHPYWIPIILIPARYGFIPGVVTGIIGAFMYLSSAFGGIPGREAISHLAETGRLFIPGYFCIASTVLGSIRQKYIETEHEKDLLILKYKENTAELEEEGHVLEKTKKILESRIIGETATLKTLYQSASALESLDIGKVYSGLLDILKDNFGVKKAGVYCIEDQHFLLCSSIGCTDQEVVESKIRVEQSIMKLALQSNTILTIKNIIDIHGSTEHVEAYGTTLLLAPLKNAENTVAVLNIMDMEFYMLTKANVNMISLLLQWISRSIENIDKYRITESKLIKDEDKDIYTYAYLLKRMPEEYATAINQKQPLAVCVIKIRDFGLQEEAAKDFLERTTISVLHNCLVQDDLLFKYKFRGLYVAVAPYTNLDMLQTRLANTNHALSERLHTAADLTHSPLDQTYADIHDYDVPYEQFIEKIASETGIVLQTKT